MLQHRSDCCMKSCLVLSHLSLVCPVTGTDNPAKEQKRKKGREGGKNLDKERSGA